MRFGLLISDSRPASRSTGDRSILAESQLQGTSEDLHTASAGIRCNHDHPKQKCSSFNVIRDEGGRVTRQMLC